MSYWDWAQLGEFTFTQKKLGNRTVVRVFEPGNEKPVAVFRYRHRAGGERGSAMAAHYLAVGAERARHDWRWASFGGDSLEVAKDLLSGSRPWEDCGEGDVRYSAKMILNRVEVLRN
jgi:hypothetical protein